MQTRLLRISLTTLGLVLCMNIVSCRAAGQELPQSEMQTSETAPVSTQIAATETVAPSETTLAPETAASTTVSESAPSTGTTFNPTIHYVPENEWSGLETKAYDGRSPAVWGYVASHPEGTPDPKPSRQGVASVSYDINNISARTEKEQYSLQNDATIIITASYAENGLFDEIYYDYHVNLDRWNGTEWERMLYVPDSLLTAFAHYQVIERGKTITKGIYLPAVVTKLVSGRYRAILYFGYSDYQPVYAEFELTE